MNWTKVLKLLVYAPDKLNVASTNAQRSYQMNYQKYLLQSVKATSRKGAAITVIDPKFFNEFLSDLKNDESLDLELRVLVAIGLSTGGRIEELLSIKSSDINSGFCKINVLKKRIGGATREAKLHPVAEELIALLKRRSGQYILRMDRKQAWYQLNKHFGFGPHAMRHSHISFLVESNMPALQITKIMNLSNTNVVAAYTHTNVRATLTDVWTKKVS